MPLNVTEKDHIQGSGNASVVLIEYADYQCPYCGEAYPIIKDIQKKLGDDLKFVFRNFPIQELHPFAVHAAIAAEIAAGKGKFWEMHDILFENQRRLDDTYLVEYAKRVGIDPAEFEKEFNDDKYFQKVKDDFNSGIKNGVQGTPAFFINGEKFDGDWTSPQFADYLKSMIK